VFEIELRNEVEAWIDTLSAEERDRTIVVALTGSRPTSESSC
jgi:hypothetical protein